MNVDGLKVEPYMIRIWLDQIKAQQDRIEELEKLAYGDRG